MMLGHFMKSIMIWPGIAIQMSIQVAYAKIQMREVGTSSYWIGFRTRVISEL